MRRRLSRSGLLTFLAAIALAMLAGIPALAEENPCMDCHSDRALTTSAGKSIFTDKTVFDSSVHGQAGIGCTACHADLEGVHEFPHAEKLSRPKCEGCHDEVTKKHSESIHGQAVGRVAEPLRPTCEHCHGAHDILPQSNPASRTNRLNIVATCSSCHAKLQIPRYPEKSGKEIIQSYAMSVHGLALSRSGLTVTAECTDCHTSHEERIVSDAKSPVFRRNIPDTCGKCHAGVKDAFFKVSHGKEFLAGNRDVPVCTDCHGEHAIGSRYETSSSIYILNIARMCSKCHDDQGITKKYDMPARRLESYLDTFHGAAAELGDIRMASCASCHGSHDIRASTDPDSPTNPANLQKTCGQCHPGEGLKLQNAKIHVTKAKEIHWIAGIVKKFYIALIVSLIGGFFAYIVMDLAWHLRRRRLKQQRQP